MSVSEGPKRATRLAVAYFVVATAALVWPIYPWLGNHIEPRLFGLPLSLTWILAVIAANFAVLAVLYRLRLIDDREHDTDPQADPQADPQDADPQDADPQIKGTGR